MCRQSAPPAVSLAQAHELRRRALAGHDPFDMVGPLLQCAPALVEIIGLVVDAGDAALVPDMPKSGFNDVRCHAELVVHGSRDKPAKIMQSPGRNIIAELTIEALLGASPRAKRSKDFVALPR